MGLSTAVAHTLAISSMSSQCVPLHGIYSFGPGKLSAQVGNKQVSKPGLPLPLNARHPFQPSLQKVQGLRTRIICSAALGARCAEGQTQTVTRQSSTITIAPVQGKEKSPELDDGGTGFPPRDDDGGGGGGGGGGPNWSGGFFFFGFLAFLGFLKDQESEGPYRDSRRR